MSLVKLSTIPESYFIDIGTESRAYTEIILPALSRMGKEQPAAQFSGNELEQLKGMVEQALQQQVKSFTPGEGMAEQKMIFGKEYALTLLNRQHRLISRIHTIHQMVEHCLAHNYSMRIQYFS